MGHISSEPVDDPDRIETLPASELSEGSAAPVSASAAALLFRLFDTLPPAPLQVRTLTPLFAGPPRLPTT